MCFKVPATLSLWFISFLGYAIQYMLLTNLNIAITDMIIKPPNIIVNGTENDILHNVNSTMIKTDSTIKITLYDSKEMRFHWNETHQSIILGGVYWVLWISHIVGGILSHKFGCKTIMSLSIFLASVLALFMPYAAVIHYRLLTLFRIIQGYIIGLAFPSIFVVVPHWISKEKRASFLTCFLGISFGNAVTYLVSGFIIELFRWKGVFYVTGTIGLIWCVACKFFMFDRPEDHPRLSEKERRGIEVKLKLDLNIKAPITNTKPVPWLKIITSVRVLSNVLSQFGLLWSIFTISIYTPKYLKFFFNLSSGMTGIYSGLPHLLRVCGSILIVTYSDRLITRKILSATFVRKMATFISNVVVGMLFVFFAYFGDNFLVAIITIFTQMLLSGVAIAGSVSAWIDMSPNFGGILQGLCGAFSHTSGILIPVTVGSLTLNNDTIEQWRKVFLISGAICIVSGLPFICVWDSKKAKWDSVEKSNDEYDDLKELKLCVNE